MRAWPCLLVAAVAAAASRASVRMGIGSAGLHGGSRGRRRRSRPVAVVGGEAMVKDEAGADEIWSDHHVWLVSALERLNFDNTAVRRLLVDPTEGGPVRQVHGSHMVRVRPSPLKSPELMATSDALLLLGLPLDMVEELAEPGLLPATVRAELSAYFAGNRLPAGADPCAAAYCGHQFGRFAGQLGDGAVISLGEIVVREDADEQAQPLSGNDGAMPARTRAGGARGGAREGLREEPPARAAVRQREDAGSDDGAGGAAAVRIAPLPTDARGRWEVQLKGAGQTPFSRAADGRKVLRSTVREFLASEAMAALGVPTTRAAALVVSESRVTRDAKGKGQTREERCGGRPSHHTTTPGLIRASCPFLPTPTPHTLLVASYPISALNRWSRLGPSEHPRALYAAARPQPPIPAQSSPAHASTHPVPLSPPQVRRADSCRSLLSTLWLV